MSTNSKFDWLSFLIGILLILAALIAFSDTAGSLAGLAIFIGLLAVIGGIIEVYSGWKLHKLELGGTWTMVLGTINILIGLFILFNIKSSVIALPYVFAVWFILDSVLSLLNLDLAKAISKSYYWLKIIISVFGIAIGTILLFNPVVSAFTLAFLVGFYFLIFGILYIVKAF
ncbi:hypothetical protein MmiEs2_07690 [Methanimicrococcus stummii]|uniref:Acid-resistance membrane protein n=1 Tax=Methanimicrococcus stummii TaxID=3028294 RepID=A0AA96VAA6_9EURY|nr:DUF308 domain-containing protein [Methanimicrococcus sp. Es2]WNY28575.1 hypothetical protein MmiEs2_07690 [Methanimicrococcus sp. Es2]